jgi:hypothetical protein
MVASPPLTRIGEATALPPRFTARWEHPEDHTVELDITVVNGRPSCEAVRVIRNPGKPQLSGAELRRLPVENWVTFACAQAFVRQNEDGSWSAPQTEEAELAGIADVERAVKRRWVNDDLLRQVAQVYEANGERADAVREAFNVSTSQAFRYIKTAREKGFIPQRGEQ